MKLGNKATHIISLILIILALIAAVMCYPYLPDQIASHWNFKGEADGYMGKFWGTFILPLIMVLMYLTYIFIPIIDPLKVNIGAFRRRYNFFWISMMLFFSYIFGLSLYWNMGYGFNFATAIAHALAVLLFTIGSLLTSAKRNWLVGIRTPWTLSSDTVWEKTHRLGGILFKIIAIFPLFFLFWSDNKIIVPLLVAPILIVTCILVVYSFLEYRKLKK